MPASATPDLCFFATAVVRDHGRYCCGNKSLESGLLHFLLVYRSGHGAWSFRHELSTLISFA
jgi:hypothetical protein